MANEMQREDKRTSEMYVLEEKIAFYHITSQVHKAILEDENTIEISNELLVL